MASCDVQTLLDSAACFDCLSPGLKESVKLQLLCEILSAGGGGGGGGTVLDVGVTTANGVSAVTANASTHPRHTFTLGAITPTSVNGNTITVGTGTLTLGAVTLNAGPGGTLGTAAFTATTSYEVPLTFSGGLTRSVNTITPGALTPISAAFSGTAGAGFISLLTQTVVPAAPASGFALYANSAGKFSWVRSDGFTRSFEVTAATGNRIFTLPDVDFTFAGLSIAQTFTAANTFSVNGAASTPSVSITGAPYTLGSGTTAKALLLVETAGATSAAWSTAGTMIGVNAPSGFTGRFLDLQLNGVTYVAITSGGSVLMATGMQLEWSGRGRITSPASGAIQLGATDAAAPVAQTLSAQSVVAGTADTAGANWINRCSLSTGTGRGGSWIMTQSLSVAASTTQNSSSTRKYFSAKPTALTSGNDITLFTVTVGTSNYIGIKLTAVVNVASATDFQCQTSTALIAVVNKAGTMTLATVTQADSGVATSSGTLTPVTYKIVDNGSGVLAVKCNATTSLTPVTFGCKWQCEIASNDVATVTAS